MPRRRRILARLTLAAGLAVAGCRGLDPVPPPAALVSTAEGVAGVKADVATAQRAVVAAQKTVAAPEPKAYLTVASEAHVAALAKVDRVETSLAAARNYSQMQADEVSRIRGEIATLRGEWYVEFGAWVEWWFHALAGALKWFVIASVGMGVASLLCAFLSPVGWGLTASGILNVLNPLGIVFKFIRWAFYRWAGIRRVAGRVSADGTPQAVTVQRAVPQVTAVFTSQPPPDVTPPQATDDQFVTAATAQ